MAANIVKPVVTQTNWQSGLYCPAAVTKGNEMILAVADLFVH